MTKSNEKSIVHRVECILENRENSRKKTEEISVINRGIDTLSQGTIDLLTDLKVDMGLKTEINIRIGPKYYRLIQNAAGVDIGELRIHIESE